MISVQPSLKTLQLAQNGSFRLDTLRTRVAFSVRHLTGRVHGVFTRVAGSVDYDARKPESMAVRVTILANRALDSRPVVVRGVRAQARRSARAGIHPNSVARASSGCSPAARRRAP
jgi:hypothetical protein